MADNGPCYRADAFARALLNSWHQRITPYTPRHNGRVERYNRILAEEFLYARLWASETERTEALGVWNIHYNYHRPRSSVTRRLRLAYGRASPASPNSTGCVVRRGW